MAANYCDIDQMVGTGNDDDMQSDRLLLRGTDEHTIPLQSSSNDNK